MSKKHEMTPDRLLNIELMDLSLPHRIDVIAKEECKPGFLYWGDGNRDVDIAICQNGPGGDKVFEVLRDIRGAYYLSLERHPEDVRNTGGWAPIVALEKVPDGLDDKARMEWLLRKEIEVVEDKLDWLVQMPDRLKSASDYDEILLWDSKYLASLTQLSIEGIETIAPQPYQQMLQEHRDRGLET